MDDVLTLISIEKYKDDYGITQTREISHEVFCNVGDVSRYEFFNGGRNGLNPSLVFEVFRGDYNDEIIVEYRGRRYSVYRTHAANAIKSVGVNLSQKQELSLDYIELYCERKGGINGSD